jgi:ABC-type Fe3+/spermidine/putrescine transport system ATPase subunit
VRKSTTLQCIAGLETPDDGEIEMDGEVVLCTRRSILVPANRRNIGMIFQSYAIWPHMDGVSTMWRSRSFTVSGAYAEPM